MTSNCLDLNYKCTKELFIKCYLIRIIIIVAHLKSRSTEILIESNFWLGTYVTYILNWIFKFLIRHFDRIQLFFFFASIRRTESGETFDPTTMCPDCGAPWETTKHKTRIKPGKTPTKRVAKMISRLRDDNETLSKGERSLAKKCKKNRCNKLVKICSICSGTTIFDLVKPKRLKTPKVISLDNSEAKTPSKKKKRRTRDKTAGLNVSVSKTPVIGQKTETQKKNSHTPEVGSSSKILGNKCYAQTPVMKPGKLNLSKLKGIIDTTVTPAKKCRLSTFLQELWR